MTFLPATPLTVMYAVVLASVSVYAVLSERRLWPVVAVMCANWIGTRAITAYDLSSLYAGLLDLSSAIVLAALWRTRAMAVLPVSALFGLMVISYVMTDLGLLSRETMWAWCDVGGYLQLLVILGNAVGGSGRLAHTHTHGRRVPALVRSATSRRVQD